MERTSSGPIVRVLSWEPIVYLGRISYGTYLWHWPIIVFAILLTNHRISPVSTFAVSAVLATALASLSFTLVEQPIRVPRLPDRLNPVVIGIGLGAGLLVAFAVIPNVMTPSRGAPARAATSGPDSTAIPVLDYDTARLAVPEALRSVRFRPDWGCSDTTPDRCTIMRGGRPHLMVIGDSMAATTFAMFAEIARTQHLTLSTAASPGCPWQRNVFFDADDAFHKRWTEKCVTVKRDLYERVLPALRPDVIVVASLDYLGDRGHRGSVHDAANEPVSASPAEFRKQFVRDTQKSLRQLTRYGAKVAIVEPLPVTTPDHDPFLCLQKTGSVRKCRFVADPGIPGDVNRVYRSAADGRSVFALDLDRLACPSLPVCEPLIDGEVTRFDYEHLTPRYAATLAPSVTDLLRRDGLLPARTTPTSAAAASSKRGPTR